MDVARPIHNKQTYKYDFDEMWILLQSYKWNEEMFSPSQVCPSNPGVHLHL